MMRIFMPLCNSLNYYLIDIKLGIMVHLLMLYQPYELAVRSKSLISVLHGIILIVAM